MRIDQVNERSWAVGAGHGPPRVKPGISAGSRDRMLTLLIGSRHGSRPNGEKRGAETPNAGGCGVSSRLRSHSPGNTERSRSRHGGQSGEESRVELSTCRVRREEGGRWSVCVPWDVGPAHRSSDPSERRSDGASMCSGHPTDRCLRIPGRPSRPATERGPSSSGPSKASGGSAPAAATDLAAGHRGPRTTSRRRRTRRADQG